MQEHRIGNMNKPNKNKHKKKQWPKGLFDFPDELKGFYPDISELRKDMLSPREIKF